MEIRYRAPLIGTWRATGTVLDATIFAVFALFKKRRNETNALLEQVRKWNDQPWDQATGAVLLRRRVLPLG